MAGFFSSLLGKKEEKPQVELSERTEKKKYDIWAALAKALLVFALSYGPVGGFLSAYGMDYNRFFCIAGILGLAVLLSLIYETEKKWFTNLCVIGIFIVYAYVAVSRFWVLNSGAYAVINKMYEVAQSYLGVTGGGLYNLQIQDSYRTVTGIALFVGVVLDILLVIRLQYKANLLRTMLLTFTLFLVPIYFEQTPNLFCLFLMLSGYVTIGMLQTGRVKKHVSGQIRHALPLGMVIAAVLVVLFGVLLPRVRYRSMVPKNPDKAATEQEAVAYAQYGIMALLMNNSAGGGINAGRLSQNITVMTDDEPDLLIYFTPYTMEPVYLKAFTGLAYDGSSWSDASAKQEIMAQDRAVMDSVVSARQELYGEDSAVQSRGIMEVYSLDDAIRQYEFRPYYTDREATERVTGKDGTGMRYVYYPKVSDVSLEGFEDDGVDEIYLTVPRICRDAVENACREAALTGTPEQITEQIFRYFSTNYAYTLRPGYYFGGMDYISYFLSKNKKGFCTHFASAGTMMFRYMGIPARYVEGYVFTYTDVVTDGKIIEGADFGEYYDGYSPLGETAWMELEVPDGNAHAWIEIYLPDMGWTVVDATPAATLEEEETGSFWDAILGGGIQTGVDQEQAREVTDYLENALAGGTGVFAVLLLAVAALFVGRWGYREYQEGKLPGRDRVKLEYGRLTTALKEREAGFAVLTTPAQELTWIQNHYDRELPAGFQEELYQVFFAPEGTHDYEKLRTELVKLQKLARKNRRGR